MISLLDLLYIAQKSCDVVELPCVVLLVAVLEVSLGCVLLSQVVALILRWLDLKENDLIFFPYSEYLF